MNVLANDLTRIVMARLSQGHAQAHRREGGHLSPDEEALLTALIRPEARGALGPDRAPPQATPEKHAISLAELARLQR